MALESLFSLLYDLDGERRLEVKLNRRGENGYHTKLT